jgi:glycosyltransferase involved in cell wall biosynthesis
LHIIGGGNDEVAIKRISNELGLTQRGVEFKGKLQGEELIQELQQADALILNSRYENQPVVILEALSCGIPVIAPSIAGIPEVINESRGILFNREDSDALKNSMIVFHSKKAQYNKLELRVYCQNTFSYSAVAIKLDNLYRKILAAC